MNRLFCSEQEVFDYVDECGSPEGDLGMFSQWKPGEESVSVIQPLGEAVWESDPNDWWWYIDNGKCRVWQSYPSDDEINTPWTDAIEM